MDGCLDFDGAASLHLTASFVSGEVFTPLKAPCGGLSEDLAHIQESIQTC